jgi:hypothetical protein
VGTASSARFHTGSTAASRDATVTITSAGGSSAATPSSGGGAGGGSKATGSRAGAEAAAAPRVVRMFLQVAVVADPHQTSRRWV